jgi:hypothetical protein
MIQRREGEAKENEGWKERIARKKSEGKFKKK